MRVSKLPRFSCLLLLPFALQAQTPADSGNSGGLVTYDGPSILGRDGPGAGMHGTDRVPIHVQGSINGSYDTNLLGYSVNSAGQLVSEASPGVEASIGVSGRKLWRRSYLGIDYGGNYGHYTAHTYYNGSNHQLNLAFSTQLNRTWQFFTQVAGGTSNRFIGGPNVFQASQFEFTNAPVGELFDSRSYFLGTTTGAIYTISNRQSIRVSGTGTTVRRKAAGLADMQSYGASGDWVYRVSRRTSVGISYTFTHYDYKKVFGESDVHTVGLHLSRKISRDWDIALSLTGTQQSTVGVRNFALDPVLSAILGRYTGYEVFESNNLLYGYAASVIRRIRRSSISFNARRGVNGGNGYFLTSLTDSAGVYATHNFSRDLAVNAMAGYDKIISLGFTAGAYHGWTSGAGVTYKLTSSFGVNARYDWRTYDFNQNAFSRTGFRVSAGITYFPDRGIAGLW